MVNKAPLAVVSMTYNEAELVDVWARHYAEQVGAAQCYLVDHGTTDESTTNLGAINVLRLPRSPQDDTLRAEFLSSFCASLLCWYDAVIYVDIDELLVADPARHTSLVTYAATIEPGGVRTAIGFDVVHTQTEETRIHWNRPVSTQRHWLRFSSAMCKPSIIRRPVTWAPGFHCIDAAPQFDDLFLFHIRYADRQSGLSRLARTRAQPWTDENAGSHQRMPDSDWQGMLDAMGGLERQETANLTPDDPLLRAWLDRVEHSAATRESELYRIDLHISGDTLWRLPDRFIGTF